MSRYLDTVRSARPEHLYVFDLDRATLDGGTVTDLGYNPINGVIYEDTGYAELEVVPSLIDNSDYATKFNVIHDRSINDAAQFASYVVIPDGSLNYLGDAPYKDWAIELVVQADGYNRARFDQESELGNLDGLSFERVDNYNRKFVFRLYNDTGVVKVAESSNVPNGTKSHLFLVKSGDTYSMYLNGVEQGYAKVENVVASLDNDFYIGGSNSKYHSDATYSLLAMYDRGMNGDQIRKHYNKFVVDKNYEVVGTFLAPRVNINFEDEAQQGTSEPFSTKLSEGVDSEELYEDENGDLMIQPDLLGAGAVTKSKKLKFDLSGMTEGVSVYINTVTTTDANSSVTVNYSFDDAAYSVATEGDDGIPELDAKWGRAV